MPVRHARYVCCFCRQNTLPLLRSHPSNSPIRDLATVADSESNNEVNGGRYDGNWPNVIRPTRPGKDARREEPEAEDTYILNLRDSLRQRELYSPVDSLRKILLGGRDESAPARHRLNLGRLKNVPFLEEPGPDDVKVAKAFISGKNVPVLMKSPFASRLEIKGMQRSPRELRSIIRDQLDRCLSVRDILRVFTIALQGKQSAAEFVRVSQPLIDALYRARMFDSDMSLLGTLNTIITRIRREGYHVHPSWLVMGLKLAARCRSLPAMARYLKEFRTADLPISARLFRSVVAKFSIGKGGLGEVRNGRWKRRELLQVLEGFPDAPPGSQYHMETFLNRDKWDYMQAWLAVLARCQAHRRMHMEWKLWKTNPARLNSKPIGHRNGQPYGLKGDYWFIEQFTYAQDFEYAWRVLAETNIPFSSLTKTVRLEMVRHLEHCTLTGDELRSALLLHYDNDLSQVEELMGVKWVSTGEETGYHVHVDGTEEVIERLGMMGSATGLAEAHEDRLVELQYEFRKTIELCDEVDKIYDRVYRAELFTEGMSLSVQRLKTTIKFRKHRAENPRIPRWVERPAASRS